jgi:hypothetical protein
MSSLATMFQLLVSFKALEALIENPALKAAQQ